MVNLPLKKNFTPVSSTASSVTSIMTDLQRQQENLSSILGTLNSSGNIFSDDLVSVSSNIDNIISQTGGIAERLGKQQQVLATIQTKSVASSTELLSSLTGEINNLKTVTSSITDQANSLNSIVDKGLNLGLPNDKVESQLKSAISSFSNTANSLISGLNEHSNALNAVITSGEKTLGGGLLSNFTDSKIPSVQNLMSGVGVNDLTAQLTSLTPSTDDIQTITREVEQKFSDISDVISSKLDDLKSSVVDPIAAKVSSKTDLLSIAGNLDGALSQAKDGLTKMQNPLSQLSDVSAALGNIKSNLASSLGSIDSSVISGFTDHIGQIDDIVGSMSNLGSQVNSQISGLTSTISDSFDAVGGFNSITGTDGGVDSLTNIVNPSSLLSSSLTDMNSLSRNLMVSASNLSQLASDLPENNPINNLSSQLISIGQSINDQTFNTPLELDKLTAVTQLPNLNLSSLENTIANTGADLTSKNISDIKLYVNVDKISQDLAKQILLISNANSIPGS